MSDDVRRDIVDQLRADARYSGLRHVREAADTIEHLCSELAGCRRELATEVGQGLLKNRRIEELERGESVSGEYAIIPADKIDEAWKRMKRLLKSENTAEHFMGRGIEAALRQDFGIVECDCQKMDRHGRDSECRSCNGHGWEVKQKPVIHRLTGHATISMKKLTGGE